MIIYIIEIMNVMIKILTLKKRAKARHKRPLVEAKTHYAMITGANNGIKNESSLFNIILVSKKIIQNYVFIFKKS